METSLQQLGLNEKEAKFYVKLLEDGPLAAAEIAKELGESRTNTYMVLDRLLEQGLVIADDKGVRRYAAADPSSFKKLLIRQQQQLKANQLALSSVLPQLTSIYQLGQHKPGVAYFEGLDGYRVFQDNVSKGENICVFGSDVVSENKEAWRELQRAVQKRRARGGVVRILFHHDAKDWLDVGLFRENGYEVRFWGENPLEGEITLYGDSKVGITAYQPGIITTVITNGVIAGTFQTLFEQLWEKAYLPA